MTQSMWYLRLGGYVNIVNVFQTYVYLYVVQKNTNQIGWFLLYGSDTGQAPGAHD